jgi:UDP-N-acetylmuramyl pentapeptide phosphotransferase/UDP-N-acetylglucosamine-1-phosphate transferase
VDRNIEQHLNIDMDKKKRGISRVNQNSIVARVINIVYFAFSILEVLLLLRVVLQLLNVNAQNSFANFIYLITAPFVSLFASLLINPTLGTSGVLEITTLLTMLVWAIVAWLLGRLIWLATSRPRGQ